jgi:hypothetical protein
MLSKIKEASTDEGNFTVVIGAASDYEHQQIIKSAKWLESEMYIRLRKCELQKVGNSEGVLLSGKLVIA